MILIFHFYICYTVWLQRPKVTSLWTSKASTFCIPIYVFVNLLKNAAAGWSKCIIFYANVKMNSILGECKGNSCLHVLSLELKICLSHECRRFKWDIFLCFMKKFEHGGMCNPGIWEAEPGGLPQIRGSPGVVYSFDCQLDSTKSHLGKDSGRDFLP